jgi:predicted alpha/beta-fold hydrolase
MLPSQFRNIEIQKPREVVIDVDLGDVIDIDLYENKHDKLIILSHGLEGHSRRPYITGMVQQMSDSFDCLAWNFKSCGHHFTTSKELYHNGKIENLSSVIEYATSLNKYEEIHLVGFSMGANLNLLYLGKNVDLPDEIKSSVAVSAAIDLKSSALVLDKGFNAVYMKRFLKKLKIKLEMKKQQYPDLIDLTSYDSIGSFFEFDNRYTAPLHGFKDVHDYWASCSSLPHLSKIRIPTLILSSLDDPFLGKSCFPTDEQIGNNLITTEYTRFGGHVGYIYNLQMLTTYSEIRAKEFISSV